jgi:hypothetical protein
MGKIKGLRAITSVCLLLLSSLLLFSSGCATVPSEGPAGEPSRHDRIVAIGDVHGSYSGLVSIMKETALIDNGNRWIGGNTLLVQTGDLLDRGKDIRQVLDLLISLQPQAETAGGKVVAILGNHEVMNIVGSRHDVNPEAYASFAGPGSEEKRRRAFERWQAFFGASMGPEGEDPADKQQKWMATHPPGFVEYAESMGPGGHYGKWLRSLPAMYQHGGTVFVHAGISPEYARLTQVAINEKVAADLKEFDLHKSYLMEKGFVEQFFSMSEMISVVDGILKAVETDELPASILDAIPRLEKIKSFFDGIYEVSPMMVDEGPLWFRGFAQWPDEQLISYVPEWLKRNNAWRVIVSHTPRSDGRIQSRLDGAIFLIDTGMLSEFYKGGQASALEIRDDEVTAVYATGERFSFPPPEIDYGPELVWTDPEGTPLPFETVDDIEQFLLTAEPIATEKITTGVNRPKKVLLEKGHEQFNAIFRHDSQKGGLETLPDMGHKKRYFIDSYLSEMAAYEMNRLLGLDNMPPTVLRTLDGTEGTLQLWAEGTMLDRERAQKEILPPEAFPWNGQMWDTRVFDNLINNFDRNQTNILIDPNWRMILIDHTRSFGRDRSLPKPEQVTRCSRGLWYALRHLDEAEVRTSLSPYLTGAEIDALFIRRELLIELIQELIDRKGEAEVLS